MPRVDLHYHGGDVRSLDADPFETVYQAASRSGVPILTDCLEGACATCKARCLSGEYELIDPSLDALCADEEEAGHVLLCQMEARTACVVEMPYSLAFAQQSGLDLVHGEVVSIDPIGVDIVRLIVEATAPVAFLAGQYAQLEVPDTGVARAYSFANPPDTSRLEFFVRRMAGGAMGEYLASRATLGDAVSLHAPGGGFYLRPGTGPLVMIAGGTGLAPLLAMLESLSGTHLGRQIRVLHGARRADELFGSGRLEKLRAGGMRVAVEYAVEQRSKPRAKPTAEPTAAAIGRVTDLISETTVAVEGTDVYVCGPPPMVAIAERLLTGYGVPDSRVHAERFNPA